MYLQVGKRLLHHDIGLARTCIRLQPACHARHSRLIGPASQGSGLQMESIHKSASRAGRAPPVGRGPFAPIDPTLSQWASQLCWQAVVEPACVLQAHTRSKREEDAAQSPSPSPMVGRQRGPRRRPAQPLSWTVCTERVLRAPRRGHWLHPLSTLYPYPEGGCALLHCCAFLHHWGAFHAVVPDGWPRASAHPVGQPSTGWCCRGFCALFGLDTPTFARGGGGGAGEVGGPSAAQAHAYALWPSPVPMSGPAKGVWP